MLSAISLNHSFNSPRITIILGTVGWGEKYNACTQKSSTSSRCPFLIKPCGAASPWHFVMDSCKPRPCGQADAALTGRRSATLGAIQQRHRVRASSCYPMLASGVDAWNEGCDTENAISVFLLSVQTGMVENKTAASELFDISVQETAHHCAVGLTGTLSQKALCCC